MMARFMGFEISATEINTYSVLMSLIVLVVNYIIDGDGLSLESFVTESL